MSASGTPNAVVPIDPQIGRLWNEQQPDMMREIDRIRSSGLKGESLEAAIQKVLDNNVKMFVTRLKTEGFIGRGGAAGSSGRPVEVERQIFSLLEGTAQNVKDPGVQKAVRSVIQEHREELAGHLYQVGHEDFGRLIRGDRGVTRPTTQSGKSGGDGVAGTAAHTGRTSASRTAPDNSSGERVADRSAGEGAPSRVARTEGEGKGPATGDKSVGRGVDRKGADGTVATARDNQPVSPSRENVKTDPARQLAHAGAKPATDQPSDPNVPHRIAVQRSFVSRQPVTETPAAHFQGLVSGTKGGQPVRQTVVAEAEPEAPLFVRLSEGLRYMIGKGTERVSPGQKQLDAMVAGWRLALGGQLTAFHAGGAVDVRFVAQAAAQRQAVANETGIDPLDIRMRQYRGQDLSGDGDEKLALVDDFNRFRSIERFRGPLNGVG